MAILTVEQLMMSLRLVEVNHIPYLDRDHPTVLTIIDKDEAFCIYFDNPRQFTEFMAGTIQLDDELEQKAVWDNLFSDIYHYNLYRIAAYRYAWKLKDKSLVKGLSRLKSIGSLQRRVSISFQNYEIEEYTSILEEYGNSLLFSDKLNADACSGSLDKKKFRVIKTNKYPFIDFIEHLVPGGILVVSSRGLNEKAKEFLRKKCEGYVVEFA